MNIYFVNAHEIPVRFLGRLSNEKVLAELHGHEIYIHTSVKESFSYSLLEAKLANLFTFARSNLQVPTEFIDKGFENYCVDDWVAGVMSGVKDPVRFDGSRFTAKKMTESTLRLALDT